MNRITFGKIREPELPEELVPPELLANNREQLLQQWERERVLVFCQRDAYNAMHAHAASDLRNECTGLMVGQAFRDPEVGRDFVVIDKTVPVDATSQSGVHVHVDVERFGRVQADVQRQVPGARLVGWYHTHPNLGIFLSSTDFQVTEGLFNASWHVATVIDPVRNEEGSFVEQGSRRLSGLAPVQQPTPITDLMSRYQTALDQLERHEHAAALRTLETLRSYYDQAINSPYKRDMRLWIERGDYRDLSALISRASANTNGGSGSATPAGHATSANAVPPERASWSYSAERTLQDLSQGQAELQREVQRLGQHVMSASVRRSGLTDLLSLLLGLVIVGVLCVDIYLQQARTQVLTQQNELLVTIITQNRVLEQELAESPREPAVPTVFATQVLPTIVPTQTAATPAPTAAPATQASVVATTVLATQAPRQSVSPPAATPQPLPRSTVAITETIQP